MPSKPFATLWFIPLQVLAWYGAILIAKPYLDSYGDMVEVWAWAQHWLMGSDKHPQVLPWLAHLWFLVAPRTVAAFYGLAAVVLAVGFYGIYALGRALGLPKTVVLAAVALEALAFPYLTLPDKLNMNAICLATWPWTAWAFVIALQHPVARQRTLYGALWGVLGAVAVLSKYYAALLLTAQFIAAVMPANRRCFREAAPWVGLATFVLVMSPHVAWQARHHFETLLYVDEQGQGLDLFHLAAFATLPVYYWIIPWPLALWLFHKGPLWRRVGQSLRWQGAGDILWHMAFGPYLLSLVAGITGFAALSEPWGIPIGFAFSLLWLRNAGPGLEPASARLLSAFRYIWPGMIALGLLTAVLAARQGSSALYYPEAEAARRIEAEFQALAPGEVLAWAAAGNDAARMGYFAQGRIEALPAWPGALPDYYPPRERWQAEGGVVICPLGPGDDLSRQTDCTTAAAARGLVERRFALNRQGLYWPLSRPYAFAAYFHLPEKG